MAFRCQSDLEPKVIHQPDVGLTYDAQTQEIGYYAMLSTLFWLNMSLALGGLPQTGLRYLGANLPLFVCSLFVAIILTNTIPRILKTPWPAGTRWCRMFRWAYFWQCL
jgi:ESS family glutamate:Na+ symporter